MVLEVHGDTLPYGASRHYAARVIDGKGTPLNAPLSWMSTDSSVVTSNDGVVTAVGFGAARIVARYGTAADTGTIVVSTAGLLLQVSPTAVAAAAGDTVAFTARVITETGASIEVGNVLWASSDTAAAEPVGNGRMVVRAEGAADVIATFGSMTAKASIRVVSESALRTMTLSPSSVSLVVGGTAQFSVSGTWSDGSTTSPAVTYTATGGTIDSLGLYTAGSIPGTYRVIAKGQRGNVADTSSVIITAPVVTLLQVVLTPDSVSLVSATTAQFSVSAKWSDGSTSIPVVTYAATGGTITAGGLYTAGTTTGSYRVIATEQSGAKADTSKVIITAPIVTLLQLILTPSSVTLAPGATVQFAVSGVWSDGSSSVPAVTFAATGGSVSASGLYTAGTTTGTFPVIATTQDKSKSDTSLVTITPPPPTSLAVVVQPSGAVSGVPFTQQPVIELRDAQNQPVLRSGVVVAVSLASGTGTLGGGSSATTDAFGKAAFTGLEITGSGSETLAFNASSLTGTSATLTVAAATLRALATSRGFSMGAAVRDSAFNKDAAYRQTLAAQYNSIVPEDATDFWPIHPGPTQYSFAAADALVNFAQANGMAFHGHTLAWYAWIPTWVTNGGYTDAQLHDILKSHITTVVGRYRGKTASWDVVNEVIDDQGCFSNQCVLRQSFWLTHLGPEYIDSAFVWARAADPGAKLYINEFRTETIMNKSDTLLALAKRLKARGVPIDGVGFQTHILQQYFPAPTSSQVQANLQRFADAGFDIRITEMDVAIPDTGGTTVLANQATVYYNILDACLKVTRCKELTTWGFSDRYNWIPKSFPGYGRALPFDSTYQAKPAFNSLLSRLGQP